ncbi:uncharacterized protein [Haliotis cracherodii]|uniref:uncharacterized protein n=1 Tax=Haliotis cracherodii TaxID=6455 RepID=UPI0039E7744B
MFPLLLFIGLALIIVHGELYRGREGYRVIGTGGSNPECCGSDCSLSRSACAVLCSRENSTCKSFNYKSSDGSCVLNQEELYTFDALFEETPAWAYYGPIANGVSSSEWTLVFKAVSGSGINFKESWEQAGVAHDQDLTNQNPAYFSKHGASSSYPFYRSHWLDDWSTAGIKEVKLGLYENGTEVMAMTFDGVGSSRDDWFSHARLRTHPYTVDLAAFSPTIFSLKGQLYRKFYITMSGEFNNCNNFGWLIVVNIVSNLCVFDKESPKPQFIYARGSEGTDFINEVYGKAEVLAVFVKFS